MYPNSVTARARGAAGLSAAPAPSPVPFPRPQPGRNRPRRKPGRPVPQRPRRKPTAPQRPAPGRAKPPSPGAVPQPTPQPYDPGHVGKPGRKPDRTPGLPYRRKPVKLPKWVRMSPWLAPAGAAAAYFLQSGYQPPRVELGSWWRPWSACAGMEDWDPGEPWEHVGWTFGNSRYGSDGQQDACIGGQSGYNNTHPAGEDSYDFYPTGNNSSMLVKVYTRPGIIGTRGWHVRSFRATGQGGSKLIRFWPERHVSKALPLPQSQPAHFSAGLVPWAVPPGQVPYEIEPQPVTQPVKRPRPLTPEMPDVGPVPSPSPQPLPDTLPVPSELPSELPEFAFRPSPFVPGVSINVRGRTKVRQRQHRARRPPRGTKETKVRANRILGFLWNSISPVTEAIDFINVLYECLDFKIKVEEYRKRGRNYAWAKERWRGREMVWDGEKYVYPKYEGRQPNPYEKLQIIYENINDLDVGCALGNYLSEQLEDMLYALGSDKVKEVNQLRDRPIGYEAGGGLTGGNTPFIGGVTLL